MHSTTKVSRRKTRGRESNISFITFKVQKYQARRKQFGDGDGAHSQLFIRISFVSIFSQVRAFKNFSEVRAPLSQISVIWSDRHGF